MTRPTRRDPEVRQVRVFRVIQARPHTLVRLLTDPRRHAKVARRIAAPTRWSNSSRTEGFAWRSTSLCSLTACSGISPHCYSSKASMIA